MPHYGPRRRIGPSTVMAEGEEVLRGDGHTADRAEGGGGHVADEAEGGVAATFLGDRE